MCNHVTQFIFSLSLTFCLLVSLSTKLFCIGDTVFLFERPRLRTTKRTTKSIALTKNYTKVTNIITVINISCNSNGIGTCKLKKKKNSSKID